MIYTIKGFPKVNEQYAYFKPIVQGFFPHFSKVQQKAFCRMTLPKSPLSVRQEIVSGQMIIKRSTNHPFQNFARNT